MNFTEGEIIAVNKPYRMTSFGALAYVRKRISVWMGVKRVKTGHAGTHHGHTLRLFADKGQPTSTLFLFAVSHTSLFQTLQLDCLARFLPTAFAAAGTFTHC